MNEFFEAYLDAALSLSMDESAPSGGNPLDDNYGREDIDSETLAVMLRDCTAFLIDQQGTLDKAMSLNPQYTMQTAGHDFFLTRNGHGSGFWDSDLGETGEVLTQAAENMGDFTLYLGDDGTIYGI